MGLQLCALSLLFIALARPQGPGEKTDTDHKGVYILILIDISNSMLAEDIKPNRLTSVKNELSRFIELSPGDYFALGVFANSAILITPFTKDSYAVKSYLKDISTDYLTNQGTDFKKAFFLVENTFKSIKENPNKQTVKAVLVASDGEDGTIGGKIAIKEIIDKTGIRVFTLSFGTKKGGVIPIRGYRNEIKEYKKDQNDQIVITKLQEDNLKKFAEWGKGSYYHVVYGGQAVKKLREDINLLKKQTFQKISYINKKELYQWFLILAFCIAFLEWSLTDRLYKKNEFN